MDYFVFAKDSKQMFMPIKVLAKMMVLFKVMYLKLSF